MAQQLLDLLGGPRLSDILLLVAAMIAIRGFTQLFRTR
jgi:hypothetical protein